LDTKISQGSIATSLRCSGIFNNHFVRQLALSLVVKEFENRSIIMCKSRVSCFFYSRGRSTRRAQNPAKAGHL